MTDVLIVIAKECLPGKAKTRLTPPLSPQQAAQVAAASLLETLQVAKSVPNVRRILYFEGDPTDLRAQITDLDMFFQIVPQCAGNLDERLAHIFDHVAATYGANTQTVLIGMDTPQVTVHWLQAAFSAPTDTTFGPSIDGGFWLLGMKQPSGDLIRGVPMSQDETGSIQYQRLLDANLTVARMPELLDIDHWADAKQVAARIPFTQYAYLIVFFDTLLTASDRALKAASAR